MRPVPRLLPLVAVSIGGVLGLKALTGVAALPALFDATAHAESAPARPAAPTALPPAVATSTAAAKPPAACAVSAAQLAKDAGLTPGELQTLQTLGTRRGQLDDRAKALDTQLHLLAAAETKVDAKIGAMNAVKAEIKALLGQADQQQQADVDRLTQVYEKMKPADAAAIMATLDDKVRIPVAARMKNSALAAILSKMPTDEAKKLTESLARRANAAKDAMAAADLAPLAPNAANAVSPDPTAPPAPAAPKGRARPKLRRLATAAAAKPAPARAAPAQAAPAQAAPAQSGAAHPAAASAKTG